VLLPCLGSPDLWNTMMSSQYPDRPPRTRADVLAEQIARCQAALCRTKDRAERRALQRQIKTLPEETTCPPKGGATRPVSQYAGSEGCAGLAGAEPLA
jgi:hypothetical protein